MAGNSSRRRAVGMSLRRALSVGVLAIAAAAACQTRQHLLDAGLPAAQRTAENRGRFDLGCPGATSVLLSDDFIQPAIRGPWLGGMERMEYTFGIEGCGKRTTIIAICQQGTGTCFAANPDHGWRGQEGSRPE
jgi:hypothetical protein